MPLKPSAGDGWPLDQGEDAVLLLDVAYAFPASPGLHVGVAVSGGGDSVALLHLMTRACLHKGIPLSAVTVDHRLRGGSAAEAAAVAALCDTLSVRHAVLDWHHGDIAGNLMDAARQARRRLITGWAHGAGVTGVALGHTSDDAAETFLMGLARASGLDGLIGLPRFWRADRLHWARPLIGQTRAALRAYLLRHDLHWAEDPTNDDPKYERVRARRAMAALAPLGIDADKIGRTLAHLRDAKRALDATLRDAAEDHVREEAGSLRVNRAGFDLLPHELQRRMLMAGLAWLSGITVPPRTDKQINLVVAAQAGRDSTLQGCRLRMGADHFRLIREPSAVAALETPTAAPWDARWNLTGPHAPDLTVRALGSEGLRACKDWRMTGMPREVLIVTPAIWRGDTLIAAPLAGMSNGWTARIVAGFAEFPTSH